MKLRGGERKARWFIREWSAIGGTFHFLTEGGKTVLGLGRAKIPPDLWEKNRTLALFGWAFPRVYGTVARIVRAEGLAEPRSRLKFEFYVPDQLPNGDVLTLPANVLPTANGYRPVPSRVSAANDGAR